MVATLATWFIAVRIIDDLAESIPALQLQAGTGLLAIVVLLIIMNWFFHKVYWTGWISAHNKKKRELTEQESAVGQITPRLLWGLGVLGFTSLYREGFEIVLFLQSYRLKMGATTVAYGVGAGLLLTAIVAVLTFIAHQRLPYRRMLVLTGVLLGVVLMVMVGEQVQEMQLAHWISQTDIPSLVNIIPDWMGLWFAVFPNVESLVAQLLAGAIVIGSYFYAERDVRAKHA